jgi:hypothetical protein
MSRRCCCSVDDAAIDATRMPREWRRNLAWRGQSLGRETIVTETKTDTGIVQPTQQKRGVDCGVMRHVEEKLNP